MPSFKQKLDRALAFLEDKSYAATIAVDLDGTLARDGTYNPKRIAPPVHNAKTIMHKIKELNVQIIINTCRGDTALVRKWLKDNDIPFDHINNNPDQPKDTSDKIMADRYWDDRQPSWPGLQYAYEELCRYLKRKQ